MPDQFKPDPYVVSRFFDSLRRSRTGRLKRTSLQVGTRLNWEVFTKYLTRLVELGLLEIVQEEGEILVQATSKGRGYYSSVLEGLQELLRTDDHGQTGNRSK